MSTQQALFSKDVSKQKRCMALLLRLKLTQKEFQRRMRQLYDTDSVQGPEAVAWGLQIMATMCEPGPDRIFLLEQMDNARNDAALMKRIRKGWQAYGTDPWSVVHDTQTKQMARYNSEPVMKKTCMGKPVMSVRTRRTAEDPL